MAHLLTKGWSETFCPLLSFGDFDWVNNREYAAGSAFVFETSGSMLRSYPGATWQLSCAVHVTGDGTASFSFEPAYEEDVKSFLIGLGVTFDSGDVITVTSAAFAYGGQTFTFSGSTPAYVTDIDEFDPV